MSVAFQLYSAIHQFLLNENHSILEVRGIRVNSNAATVDIYFDTDVSTENLKLETNTVSYILQTNQKAIDICIQSENRSIIKYVIASQIFLRSIGIFSNNNQQFCKTCMLEEGLNIESVQTYRHIIRKLSTYKWKRPIYKYCLINDKTRKLEIQIDKLIADISKYKPTYCGAQIEIIKSNLLRALLEIDLNEYYQTILYFKRVTLFLFDMREIEKFFLRTIRIWIDLDLELPAIWLNFVTDIIEGQKLELASSDHLNWFSIRRSLEYL